MNKKLYRILFLVLTLFAIQATGYTQVNDALGGNTNAGSVSTNDTLSAKDSVIVKNAFFQLFKGKPGKAALYSLLIPSGGQWYNRKYWKVPLALGIDGGLGYNVWYQTSQYNRYQKLYLQALSNGDNNLLTYKANRDSFRKAKEFSWLYLLLGHIITTMDAYVDRHLMDFDVSPDISLHSFPFGNTIAFGVNIPIHRNIR